MRRPAPFASSRFSLALSLSAAFGLLVACLPTDPGITGGDASTTGSGGTTFGTGGQPSGSGGTTFGTGGQASGSGGTTFGTGGQPSGSGGGQATGGSPGSGGTAGRGTAGRGAGGTTATGGTAGRGSGGGAVGGRGGTGTGGRGTGGSGTGGTGTGGAGTGGRGTGGSGTGGQGPTACNNLGTAHNGDGSFTFYNFAMGTARDGSGYRTACGYYGTANGTTDTVQNIASMSPANATYFAAIPGTNGFNTSNNCGACVQITGQNGRVIVATIIDECPYGSDGGNTICGNNASRHLDLSKSAFDQLGYPRGDPTGTTWRFIPCPVTGNVVIRVKSGNPNELFVENSILALTTVQGASRTSYGAWHFNSNLASGQSLQLTDVAGRSITVQLAHTNQNVNQDTGRQFPSCQ